MNILELISARLGIEMTRQKIKASREEFEKSKPDRVDIIESMKESENRLFESYLIFMELEKELSIFKNHASTQELQVLKMHQQINGFQSVLDEQKEGFAEERQALEAKINELISLM